MGTSRWQVGVVGSGLWTGGAGVLFVAAATLGFAVFGVSGVGGRLLGGAAFVETLSGAGGVVLGVWMACAVILSLALPVVALVIWGRNAGVRGVLLPYLLVLVAQIVVEMVLAGVFFPNIVVLTGLAFTLFRLGQLVSARRAFAAAGAAGRYGRACVGIILSLGLLFWSGNLAFLVLVALPRVLRFG